MTASDTAYRADSLSPPCHHSRTRRYIDDATDVISSHEMTIEVKTDFDEFSAVCRRLAGQNKCQPITLFDPKTIDNDAFWIKGTTATGDIQHVQAVRHLELADMTLTQYWKLHRQKFRPVAKNIDPSRSIFDDLPVTSNITGSVAYHGEMFISEQYRGSGLVLPLARMAKATAFLRDPDYIIGFVEPKIAYCGIPLKYGYQHVHPNAISWYQPDTDDYYTDWFLWNAASDMAHLINQPVSIEHPHILRPH